MEYTLHSFLFQTVWPATSQATKNLTFIPMKSKFALIALLTGFAIAIAAPTVHAQDTGSKKPAATKSAKPKLSKEEQSLARLTKTYNLTADQQVKVKALLDEQSAALAAAKADTGADAKAQGQKIKAINNKFNKDLNALLTPEQLEQKKKAEAERRAAREKEKEAKTKKASAGQTE